MTLIRPLLTVLLALLLSSSIAHAFTKEGLPTIGDEGDNIQYESGVIKKVLRTTDSSHSIFPSQGEAPSQTQLAEVTVTSGKLNGKTLWISNLLSGHPAYDIIVKPGSRVILSVETSSNKPPEVNLADRDRRPAITLFLSLFLLAMLLLGGVKGLKSVGLMLLAAGLIYQLVLPGVLHGQSPTAYTLLALLIWLVVASFSWQTTLKKRLVAILSVLGGIGLSAGLMAAAIYLAPLSGFTNEEVAGLWQSSPQIHFSSLLVAGTFLGLWGFLFHLVSQILGQYPDTLSTCFKARFETGVNLGKENLGSLTNALLLLYLGLFLPTLLDVTDINFLKFINLESITTWIMSALTGGLTLILTVPLTSVIAAWLLKPASSTSPTIEPTK